MDNIITEADIQRLVDALRRRGAQQVPAPTPPTPSPQNDTDEKNEKKAQKRARKEYSGTKTSASDKKRTPSVARGSSSSSSSAAPAISEASIAASSATPRVVLPTVTWNSYPNSGELSIVEHQMHEGDVNTLGDAVGLHLVRCAGCPQYLNHSLIVSNIHTRRSESERNIWLDSIVRHLPLGVSLSRAVQRDPIICSSSSVDLELMEVLPLSEATVVGLPPRPGLRPQFPPVVLYLPAAHEHATPHIFSFLPRAQTDLLRDCSIVGAVRCYAWNPVDIALNTRMILTALVQLLENSLRRQLVVIPCLIAHNLMLDPPTNYEVIYRVFYGSSSTPLAVLSALFGVTSDEGLAAHPGIILQAEFPFLLVRNSEMLLGLPFDSRLTSPNRALPANVVLTVVRYPLLRHASFAQALTIVKQLLVEGGVSVSSEVLRIIRRTNTASILLFTRSPLINAIAGPLSKALPGATASTLNNLPEDWEPSRLRLLDHLHRVRDAEWHANVVRPLPHGPAGSTPPPPVEGPSADLFLQDTVRRLEGSISRCEPLLTTLENSLQLHAANLDLVRSDLQSLEATVSPLPPLLDAVQSLRDEHASVLSISQETATRVGLLSEEVAALKGENSHIKSELWRIESAHKALKSTVETLLTTLQSFSSADPLPAPSPYRQEPEGSDVDEAGDDDTGSDSALIHPESHSVDKLAGGLNFMAMLSPSEGISFTSEEVLMPSTPLPSPVAVRGTDLLLDQPGTSDAPPAAGLSFASQVSPSALTFVCPPGLIKAAWVDIMGCRGLAPADLDLNDMHLSAGLTDSANASGVGLIRITILLPRVHWGASFLLPISFSPKTDGSSTEQADHLLMATKVTCHRMLASSPASMEEPSPTSAVKWKASHFAPWVTLATPINFGNLLATEASLHFAVVGNSCYSLRASLLAPRTLLSSLAWTALQNLGDGLKALQVSALEVTNVLWRTSITVGPYILSFKDTAQDSAAIILRALASPSGALTDQDIMSLTFTCKVCAALDPPADSYGSFNILHAVSAWHHDQDENKGGFEFLKTDKDKKGNKRVMGDRKQFFTRFPKPPERHADSGLWDAFQASIITKETKLPLEFSDSWMMMDPRKHSWLGRFWNYQRSGKAMCAVDMAGPMSVRDLSEPQALPQVALFSSDNSSSAAAPSSTNVRASCFTLPAVPADAVETIRRILMEKFIHLAPSHPSGRHTPDPMGIDYPARINA
jgi:hypothetical protein